MIFIPRKTKECHLFYGIGDDEIQVDSFDKKLNENNKSLTSAIKKYPDYSLISIHNHPESKPPSGSDLYSCGKRKYKMGIICCHNGDVYTYKCGKKPFSSLLFDKTVDKYIKSPYNMSEMDAYVTTLKQFEKDYGIKWEMR